MRVKHINKCYHNFKIFILFYITLLAFCCGAHSNKSNSYREFSVGSGERALFPNIFNLATHAEIRATSTCGQYGQEYFCKLVEHVFLRQPQCDICDANNHNKNHPIDNAIDGTRRWWQSPSLGNGLAYEQVNITIDLRQEYQVAYVILKAGISPRPGTWVLEKSLDGINYTPWQYFAISDSDCMRVFGVPATIGVPKFERDDSVICTSYYSKLNPLEYGEVHTSLVNGRPGSNHTSIELQAFTRTRFVRLRLLSLRTLYADLMIINQRDGKLDQSVTRRYFYSISDISIGGQCICYGHAERCPPEETHGQFRCECQHYTYGESCNRCLPLYNQLPWKPGTHDHPNICQACQCFNHTESCVYDKEIELQRLSVTPEGIYEGGGKCVNCLHNTIGNNCEKCLLEFYRPSNYSHYRSDACHPCNCDLVGSENNLCIRDETETHDNLRPGDCICKTGFGGRRCDRCAIGYRNYPICDPCPCNQLGSLNFETCEEEHCSCKANVEGEFCDRCKPGTLYLDKINPLGCQSCFCFGKSTECSEHHWGLKNIYPERYGWNLTDMYDRVETLKKENTFSLNDLNIFNSDDYRNYNGNNELYYWKIPFTGKWLNSYGSNLYYYIYFVPREQENFENLAPGADLVIEGNDARLEYYSRLNFFPRENISVTIPIRENANWYDARSRRPIDKADLMRVLSNVENVFVRAKYHQNQLQSSIYGLRRESAYSIDDNEVQTNKVLPIEMCRCPEHFEGNSCERCEIGYRRVSNQLYDGICEKCDCQNHSEQCDPFTGHCVNCQHNTIGPRCEHCALGYYGNPSLGGLLGACKPCACPTVENSHSKQCTLSQLVLESAAAANQDEFVCIECETGYDGNKCEICADGYYGNSFEPSGCHPCNCSGNIDLAAIGNCNRKTGVCLRCIGHTTGDYCERCEENYYGSALQHVCNACNCHHIGSIQPQCDLQTGKCQCKKGYVGMNCNRCQPDHGDIENGCPECNCSKLGAIGTTCDEVSGQCSCKKGVFGKNCNQCIPSYYNFTINGCEFCNCDKFGAVPGKECHNVTGECQCQPNVEGISCQKCVESFFNITSGQGCEECKCNKTGSNEDNCDVKSGQCFCKPGVVGLKCDECDANHWGFNNEGCKRCKLCPAPGQVCDQHTGECVCPPNTQGLMCERCTLTSWNYHPYRGCELCDCNGIGADGTECNPRTGQCKCRFNYIGHKCDQCEAGYFNFPDCEPCNCNLAGSEPNECSGSNCLCTNKGQCKCKKNVVGLKCDKCNDYSFSLEAQNPNGCTECFCFNRTKSCSQSNYIWRQIYSLDRLVQFEAPFEYYTRRHNIHILRESPLNYNSYPTNHTPLYWPLSNTFLGDRTTSYNGWIRFRIHNNANHRNQPDVRPDVAIYRLFPQVIIFGNSRLELEYTPRNEIPLDGKYKIHLHESEWTNRISPQLPVTRKQFMTALQKVQAIYIRATYNDVYRGDSISITELSIDVAQPNDDALITSTLRPYDFVTKFENTRNNLAIGVEFCHSCPKEYKSLSCQDPAVGYYRFRPTDFLNNPDDGVLVGIATLCKCNGHSNVCDSETGRCNECLHNTVGDSCDFCRTGYYGNALNGHANVCKKCACPSTENSFSATCHSVSNGRGYVCDNCRSGYSGQYCESCMSGYYGNPTLPDGLCLTCACHKYGSKHDICHNVTGQCLCKNSVKGRDCSLCSPRHAFINGVCTSCDRGCHKELMKLEDEMEYALATVSNLADLKPIPHKRLLRISSTVTSLNEIIDNIKSNELNAGEIINEVNSVKNENGETSNRYAKQTSVVQQEFDLIEERNNDSIARLNALTNNLRSIQELVQKQKKRVKDVSNQITQLSERTNEPQNAHEIHYLVSEANEYLNSTRHRDYLIDKNLNYAKKNAEDSEQLLKNILSKKLDNKEYKQLLERYNKVSQIIKDFRNALWDRSKTDSDIAKNFTHLANNKLLQLKNIINNIINLNGEAKYSLLNDTEISDSIKFLIDNIRSIFEEIKVDLIPKFKEQQEQYKNSINDYTTATNNLKVHEAQSHGFNLEYNAHQLQEKFNSIQKLSTNALAASNAYKEIYTALKNASKATKAAKTSSDDSVALVNLSSKDSLVNLTQISLDKSNNLNQKTNFVLKDLILKETTSRLKDSLNNIKQFQSFVEKNITWIKDVQQLLDDHHDRINTVYSTVDEANNSLKEIDDQAEEFNNSVTELKERVDAIQSFNHHSIQVDINNVSKSAFDLVETEKSLGDVKSRTDRYSDQFRNIRQELNVLKEKINEAREKASKIRIAVKSNVGDNCVREYISPIYPVPSNFISLKYRPAIDSPDSLIFLTTTKGTRSQSREYIAIELKGKKIHVKWDIGSGQREAAIIKRNIVYIPTSDRYTWYHIDVKRLANTVKISVVKKQTIMGEVFKNIDEPTYVTVGEPDSTSDVIFNTMPGHSRIYIGHIDSKLTNELNLVTNRFHGILGEINVDDNNVPLWVFDKSTGICDGFAGPQIQAFSGHIFKNGFAQIRMPMNDRASSLISVQFSAYSPNGLLYFRGSPSNGEFVAISLRQGIIEFKANYGGTAISGTETESSGERINIVLRSTKSKYSDGKPHKVRVFRNKGEINLEIDQDDVVSATLVEENAILEVSEPDHYIAGVPPSFDQTVFEKNDIQFDGFFGCIQSVRPNQVSELDLDHPYRSQHKEIGCFYRENRLTTLDRVFGFSNGGYILTNGVELTTNSSFAFNFRTRNANAVFLYQSTELKKTNAVKRKRRSDENTFFGFVLAEGQLFVHLSGLQRVTLKSNQSYNDGFLHSVFFSRFDTEIIVRIDDREVLTTTFDDETPIGSANTLLLFGRLPEHLVTNSEKRENLATSDSLIGCLSDFQYNYERFPLVLEEHSSTTLGSCAFDEHNSGKSVEATTSIDNIVSSNELTEHSQNSERRRSQQSLEPIMPTQETQNEFNRNDKYETTPKVHLQRRESTCNIENASLLSNGNKTFNEVRFGISDSSHARINFNVKPYPDFLNFNLSFAFRTHQKNALIWAWASYKNYERYFFLNIEHGFLTLVIKGHREPKYLHYKARKFNDNEWHSVNLAKIDHKINLQVDEYPSEYLNDAPNPKIMRKRMYVGGVISKHRKMFNDKKNDNHNKPTILPGFVGCIRDFRVNNELKNLLESSRDLNICSYTKDITYIHDGGYAVFNPIKNNRKTTIFENEAEDIEIGLQFKLATETKNENKKEKIQQIDNDVISTTYSQIIIGLFSSGENSYQSDRLIFRVENSSLILSAHFSRHHINIEEKLNIGLICPNKWHHLNVRLLANSIFIKLNSKKIELNKSELSHSLLVDLGSLPIHIGGASASVSVALNTKSLFGCMKNLEISKIPVSFESAKKLHKIVKNGCPFEYEN